MNTTRPQYDGTENCAGAGMDVFFHNGAGTYVEAEGICDGCPMLDRCFEYALTSEEHGYWAGTTALDRAELRTRLGVPVITSAMMLIDFLGEDLSIRALAVDGQATARREEWRDVPLASALNELDEMRRGSVRHGKPKLTATSVREIKTLLPTCSNVEIADAYGVSRSTVHDIRSGDTWVGVA